MKSPLKSAQSQPFTPYTIGQFDSINEQADAAIKEAAGMQADFVPSTNPETEIPKLDVSRAKGGRSKSSAREAMHILHSDSSREQTEREKDCKEDENDKS